MNIDPFVDGDYTDLERRVADMLNVEPTGATTGLRPYQALLAASAMISVSPFGALLARVTAEQERQRVRERILGKEATHVIVDEIEHLNRQMMAYADMQLQGGWVWRSYRTRNLSHRPAGSARKRKAALKQAARLHRSVARWS